MAVKRPNISSYKIKDYKCFLNENNYQGFDEIKPINIIIGKNNSGKSKIIEHLKQYIEAHSSSHNFRGNSQLSISKTIEDQELGFSVQSRTWEAAGHEIKGKKVTISDSQIEVVENYLCPVSTYLMVNTCAQIDM